MEKPNTIPNILPNSSSQVIKVQSDGFSDASGHAYTGGVQIRPTDSSGNMSPGVVTAKSKVAPIKFIPQLELCGALIVSMKHAHAWMDSTIVLNLHDGNFKTCGKLDFSNIRTLPSKSRTQQIVLPEECRVTH